MWRLLFVIVKKVLIKNGKIFSHREKILPFRQEPFCKNIFLCLDLNHSQNGSKIISQRWLP